MPIRWVLPLVRVVVVTVATIATTSGGAASWADVTVTPAQAVRGDAAEVTVRVTDDRDGAYTRQVELRFPAEAPIAEVYPMSTPDWAPKMTNRTVNQPLGGLHHGQTTQVVSAITWIRVTPPGPSDAAELTVSMGPMPETDRLLLDVVQTYSDGTVVDWRDAPAAGGASGAHPAAVLTLVAPPAEAAPADDAAADAEVADAAGTGLSGGVLGGIALGVVLGAGIILLLRRRAAPDDDADAAGAEAPPSDQPPPDDAGAQNPVGAGTAGRSRWRLRE